MIELEIYKDIPDYEGYYQVSNLGNVKSLKRIIPHSRKGVETIKERILKQTRVNGRYCHVVLQKNNSINTILVHRLVALTFIGESNLQVDHINNNKWDNRLVNLQYLSSKDNVIKARKLTKKSSIFPGVSRSPNSNKWKAQATINGKNVYLGLFKCETSAYLEYCRI